MDSWLRRRPGAIAPILGAIACTLLGLGLVNGGASEQRSPTREQRFVDSVLARLTLAERVGRLNRISGLAEPTGPGGAPARADQIRRGEIGSFLNVVGADSPRKLSGWRVWDWKRNHQKPRHEGY